MDNVWAVIALFLGGVWLIGWTLARMEKRGRQKDQQRLNSVNRLHSLNRIFQARFNKIDNNFTLTFKDVRRKGNSPGELGSVIISLLALRSELTDLRRHMTKRLIADDKSWLLQIGYAKQTADYYHLRWDGMINVINTKLGAVNRQLEEFSYDNSNSKAAKKH